MNIRQALEKLDTSNDDHWTADGMPRVDVVAELIGNTDLKRIDITSAAPDFTRDAPLKSEPASRSGLAAATESPAPSVAVEPKAEDVEGAGGDTAGNGAQVPASPLERLQAELETTSVAMYAAQATFKEAKVQADAAANKVNDLNRRIDMLEKSDPHHSTAHIRDYLAQQRKNRLDRSDKMQQFLGASGIALKDVAGQLDPRVPLDRAMHGRKPARGSVRPVYVRP